MIKGGVKKTDKFNFKAILPELCSFIIPVFIVVFAFAGLGIYPGGKSLLLTYDLRAQLLALYGYLSNGGPGYDTLFHSMSGGLGGGFFGTAALYLSPFDFIYSFVPLKSLPDAIYFMIIIKIGLCGLFCSLFLKKNGKFVLSDLWVVILSCCYALMSYNIMYFMSPMWYDEVMFLPILALLLEKIISGKKSPAFILLMTFCIVSDYYIAYMNVIALIIYFVFRLVEEGFGFKESLKRFSTFALSGFLSAGMSMFVILPVYMDFARGKFSEGSSADGDLIKNSLLDVIMSFRSQSYSGLDYNASPNIFCGTVVLALVLIWLFYGKKNIKTRVAGLLIILFYFASFIFGPLDRAWHGFRDPVCFSVRYAFTYCFFMICFAIRGIDSLKNSRIKISKSNLGLVSGVLALFTIIELYVNGSFIVAKIGTESGYTFRDEYERYCDVAENLIPYEELYSNASYGRLVTSFNCSAFDGALYGYDGLARFTSSYNLNLHEFFRKIGIGSLYHTLSEKGITPPSAGLINARYYIYYWIDQSDHYYPIKEYKGYRLYENETALPFAYEVNSVENPKEFTEDPYNNLNVVYSELFGNGDGIDIFMPVTYEYCEPEEISLADEDNVLNTVSFTPDKTGHYFFFVEYKAEEENIDDEEDVAEHAYNDIKPVYRNYYFDGEKLGEYGNKQYSYCVDLGKLEVGESHFLSLESSNSEIGEIWLYYYNDEAYSDIYSSVNGYGIKSIDNHGIVLSGSSIDASQVLVSLPFETGYKVYVDGKEVEYASYRECLMVISVSEGTHEIRIKYVPNGLYVGLIISSFSVFVFLLFVLRRVKQNPIG